MIPYRSTPSAPLAGTPTPRDAGADAPTAAFPDGGGGEPSTQEVVADLLRAKVAFQQRAIVTHLTAGPGEPTGYGGATVRLKELGIPASDHIAGRPVGERD